MRQPLPYPQGCSIHVRGWPNTKNNKKTRLHVSKRSRHGFGRSPTTVVRSPALFGTASGSKLLEQKTAQAASTEGAGCRCRVVWVSFKTVWTKVAYQNGRTTDVGLRPDPNKISTTRLPRVAVANEGARRRPPTIARRDFGLSLWLSNFGRELDHDQSLRREW